MHCVIDSVIGYCPRDGLYYKDDTTFVICSNGYASEQPCPAGTKTGEVHIYPGGYFNGPSDLCNINIVEYEIAPSSYTSAPTYTEKETIKAAYKVSIFTVSCSSCLQNGHLVLTKAHQNVKKILSTLEISKSSSGM